MLCLVIMVHLRLHRAARPDAPRSRSSDDFTRFAVAGLVVVFGFQSVINMGVNLQLMPAKGMTLPFISYGGSSLIAIAISMGMVLALTRKRPEKAQDRRRVSSERMPRGALPAGIDHGEGNDPAGRRRHRRPSLPAEALAHELVGAAAGRCISPPTTAPSASPASFPADGDPSDPVRDASARRTPSRWHRAFWTIWRGVRAGLAR